MKARKTHSRAARAPLFSRSSIGSAVAMALIATGAQAAGTSVDATLQGTVTGTTAGIPDAHTNLGNVGATISGATVGTTSTGTPTIPSPISQATNGNLIGASATGNVATSSVGTLATPINALDNAATLAIGISNGVVSSKVENSRMSLDSSTFQGGSVLNSDNTISSTTTLNSGTSLVSGTAGAGPAQAGSATLIFPAGPTLFNASGNIAATSVQSAAGATSTAAVQGNAVALQLTSNANSAVTGSAALERNTVAAVLKGNVANTTAQIQSGGAPTFAGSALVSNLQLSGNGILAAAHSASNAGTVVSGTIAGAPGFTDTLKGSLSVQGNTISSAITGNEALGATAATAGNRIVLGDGLSVAGTAGAPVANDSTHAGVGTVTNVKSDLAVVNSQGNIGTGLSSYLLARTSGASVAAGAQALDGGSVQLRGNSITADASGSTASSAIATGVGAASFAATGALSSQQTNVGTSQIAIVDPSSILAQTGDATHGTVNGTVSVSGNRSAATAQGNQVTQTMTLGAGNVAIGNTAATLTGGTSSDGRVSAAGAVTITNLQGNYNDSGVGATNGNAFGAPGSLIWLVANGGGAPVSNSTLSSTANRQEAVALGNGASNSLALAGTTVGTGAGIASVQMGDATSGVGAGLDGAQAKIAVLGSIGGKTAVALTDNVQRAVSYGNSAANTVNVAATNVAAVASNATASSITVNPAVGLPFDNTFAAQPAVKASYGVFNDQSVQANVNSAATGADGFTVAVIGNAAGSSVANDRNAFVAAAYANDASNAVALQTTNVSAPGFVPVANVTNTQAVSGNGTSISATASGGVVERTLVAGNLDTTTVSASGNTAQALAVGSRAAGNTVSVKGANIATAGTVNSGAALAGGVLSANASFSVQNAQAGQGRVSAERTGGPEVLTRIDGTLNKSSVVSSGNTAGADATSNSAVNGVAIDATQVATTSAVQNLQLTSADVISRTGLLNGALNTLAGVQVSVGGNSVQGSSVAVDANVLAGSATGNAAASSIDVKATNIASGNGQPIAGASSGVGATSANADHALSNTQLALGTQSISSRVGGAFGIDTAGGAAIGASSLSVSGNKQSAQATANTATNSVALAGTGVSARSALQSTQASFASVDARSSQQAYAPAAVAGSSSVNISGNRNSAAGVINDATNTLSVKADSSVGLGGAALVVQGALPGNTGMAGDQLLLNRQSAANAVNSAATTAVYNQDGTLPVVAGLNASSFVASGNSTVSQATANQATNASSLAGATAQAAGLAVLNVQDSTATSTATADNATRLTLAGPAPFSGASATLDGNITRGIATGNAATNSLDVKGGAIGGSPFLPTALATTTPLAPVLAFADQALVNVQAESGAVSSTVTGSTGIRTTPGAAIGASTLSVSGNTQAATAVANTAVNSVSLSGSNVSSRAALQSLQTGTAPVTASSDMAVFAPAGSTGSAVRLSGNSNVALGVVNDVTNTLAVTATNTQPAASVGTVALVEALLPGAVAAAGDQLVSSRQVASGVVQSTATTTLKNDDSVPGAAGLLNGSLAISGNTTFAEASANRASNSASVVSGATQGASVGIVNSQASSAATTANASTVATVGLAPTIGTALNSGSVSLDGNTTAALARGNAATNVLTSGAGSGYGAAAALGGGSLLSAPLLALNVGASAAILNSQTNAGAVSASSTGTSYQVALNAIGAPAVSGGTVGVTGNTLAAQAYGNSATNVVTQTALNIGTPSAAIGNYQVNTGNVTAKVTGVNFGVGVTGPVGNGSLRTTGNQITASATGNSAVSSIAAR